MSINPATLAPLGSLCDVITKGSSPNWQGFQYCEAGIPFVRSQNVGWGTLNLNDVAHLPEAFNQKEKKSVLRTDDVLLNLVGASIGRACVATSQVDGGNVNQAVAVIRVRKSILVPRYLKWFLISPIAQARIHSEKVDVARANFSLEDTRSLPIPVMPLPEQRRIVAEIEKQFRRLEAGVAALRRVQANLKRYRAAVLKAACEGKLVPTEAELSRSQPSTKNSQPAYATGAELLVRILTERRQNWGGRGNYKQPEAPDTTDLPNLPDGWAYVSVETVGFVQLGRQRAPKHHTGANMRSYLRVANVYEDRIDLSDVKEMNFTPEEFEIFCLKPNDILLNEGQSLELVGRPAIYRGELPGACFTNTLVRFRPCPSLDVKFALSVFRAFMHSGRFQKIANWTTNIAHLGADRFAKLAFPLPPLAEQIRIVAEVERRLSVVEELESVVTANLQRATRLRQSILQKAFTGGLLS